MKSILKVTTAAALLLGALAATAAELGDPAPELKIAKWVKGEPVQVTGDDKNIYVVEFWATWCPPCRTSIPHLTDLQKRFKDKNVIFIGISDEKENVVKPFVQQMGDKMDYRVALDDKRGTSAGYMQAYGIGGIPHAFVVQNKKVLWQGHPMDRLDATLEEITSNKYDLNKAKARGKAQDLYEQFREAAMEGNEERARKLGKELQTAAKEAGGLFPNDEFDPEKELNEIKEQTALHEMAREYFDAITKGTDAAAASKNGEALAAKLKGQPSIANEISWTILTSSRVKHKDVPLALQIAKQACADSEWKDPQILDTYARALFESGKKQEAVEFQEKAVAAAEAPLKGELEKVLRSYKEGKLPAGE